MSTSGDNVELKAGHAPAEKIGGVRVARKEKQEIDEVKNPASNEGQETSDALNEIRESNNVLASSGLAGQFIPNLYDSDEYIDVDGAPQILEFHNPPSQYFNNDNEQSMEDNIDYDFFTDEMHVYNPDGIVQNYIPCDLCEKAFLNRDDFNNHRYQDHGAIISICACPDPDCNQAYASLGSIKRHLTIDHNLPIESHYKKFENTTEFSVLNFFMIYKILALDV